jgi:hypothetical protein
MGATATTGSRLNASFVTRGSEAAPMFDSLAARVRGEYREMPGLRLTLAQACRLSHLDRCTCEAVLNQLAREGFLDRTLNGAFMATKRP